MKRMKRFFAGLSCLLILAALTAPCLFLAVLASEAGVEYTGAHLIVSIDGVRITEELLSEEPSYTHGTYLITGEADSPAGVTLRCRTDDDRMFTGYLTLVLYRDDNYLGEESHYLNGWNNREAGLLIRWYRTKAGPDTEPFFIHQPAGFEMDGKAEVRLSLAEILQEFNGAAETPGLGAANRVEIQLGQAYMTQYGNFKVDLRFVEENVQVVQSTAAPNPGEDDGTEIREDVVEGWDSAHTAVTVAVSLGGALAAAGAAGAALSGSAGGQSGDGGQDGADERKKKTYRMKVYKNFGDALRRGDEPVKVWARIVEVVDGTERNAPWLSERITVSGTGMTVRPLGMENTYMGAEISVPADSDAERAVLSFTYAGEGGVFRNNIVFRVIGAPEIRFADPGPDGQGLVLRETGGAVFLLGDGRTCEILFCLRDAVGAPKDLKLTTDRTDLAELSWEKLPRWPHTYKAVVRNLTRRPEEGIFAQARNTVVSIRASFENGDTAEAAFGLAFWPEGLSVRTGAQIEAGRLVVHAYVDELQYGDDVELVSRFIFTDLHFTLAVPTGTGVELLQPKDDDLQFGRLKGEGAVNHNIAAKYRFTVGPTPNAGLYQLRQQDMLYEQENPFLVELPITARYGQQTWQTELPIRLRGKDPEPMDEESEIERKKLLFRLKKFVDDDAKRAEWVFLLKEKMSDGHVSAATFRLMSKAIIRDYMDYWTQQGEDAKFAADAFDLLVSAASCTKWVCSVSFSYAMEAYAGPVASAILQPVFDLILDSVEELTAAFVEGRTFDPEKLQICKHISDGGDNVAANMLGSSLVMGNPAAWKKNAQYISMYVAYSFLRNLAKKAAETGEVDIPGVLFDTLKDLTVNMLKIMAGHLFQAWLKNREFQQQAGKAVAGTVRKGAARFFARNGGAVVVDAGKGLQAPVDAKVFWQKFISEEVGADTARLIDWGAHKYDTMAFDLRNNGDLVFSFALWEAAGQEPVWCEINLSACFKDALILQAGPLLCSPFGVLYQLIFGSLPAAEKPVTFPKDPPLTTRHRERLAREGYTTMRDEYWSGRKEKQPPVTDGTE